MTRRAAKITMLPSQGLSAKLAGMVLPWLEDNNAKSRAVSPKQQGQIRRLDRRATPEAATNGTEI